MTLLFAWGDTVRKVKHSSVTIANPLSALDRGYGVFQSREDFSDGLGLSLFDPLDNFALVLLFDIQLFARFARCQEVALKWGLDR